MIELITSPILTVIITVILWWILYTLFTRVFILTERQWKKLEFIWIFTGFIGLITLVNDNSKLFSMYKFDSIAAQIKNDLTILDIHLRESITCRTFQIAENSPKDLPDRVSDQNKFCEWSKKYTIRKHPVKGIPSDSLAIIDKAALKFQTDFLDNEINHINTTVYEINKKVKIYNQLDENINANGWRTFASTSGILFIIIALALRLAIASRNLATATKKTNN